MLRNMFPFEFNGANTSQNLLQKKPGKVSAAKKKSWQQVATGQ